MADPFFCMVQAPSGRHDAGSSPMPDTLQRRLEAKRHRSTRNASETGYHLLNGLLVDQGEPDWAFFHDLRGKPVPSGPFHASISHTDDLVVAIVSNLPIGIDVERVRRIPHHRIDRVFTEREIARITAASAPDPAFFFLWTRKEALLKALGTGFQGGPKGIEVLEDTVVADGIRWHLATRPLSSGHLLSLAGHAPIPAFFPEQNG